VPQHIFVNPYYSVRPVCWRNAIINGIVIVFFSNVIQSELISRRWMDHHGVCHASVFLLQCMTKCSTVSGIPHVSQL